MQGISEKVEVNNGWDYPSHKTSKQRGGAYMVTVSTILQSSVKLALILCVLIGIVFMMTCTVLGILCFIRGDIRISITSKSDKDSE